MTGFRTCVLVTTLFLLTACAGAGGNVSGFYLKCTAPTSKVLENADWEQAKKLFLRIRQDTYFPTYVGLTLNRPYVLTVENGDDVSHYFRAIDFFRSVAISAVKVNGVNEYDGGCIDAFKITPNGQTEIRFVALRDGSYEFSDNPVLLELALAGNPGGFITVEPARVIIDTPLPHLELLKSRLEEGAPDSEEPSSSPGLFDDEEPSSSPGLFDDEEPQTDTTLPNMFDQPSDDGQPIDAAPSEPVVSAPTDAMPELPSGNIFGEPEPAPESSPDLPELPFTDQEPSVEDPAPDTGTTESVPETTAPEPSPLFGEPPVSDTGTSVSVPETTAPEPSPLFGEPPASDMPFSEPAPESELLPETPGLLSEPAPSIAPEVPGLLSEPAPSLEQETPGLLSEPAPSFEQDAPGLMSEPAPTPLPEATGLLSEPTPSIAPEAPGLLSEPAPSLAPETFGLNPQPIVEESVEETPEPSPSLISPADDEEFMALPGAETIKPATVPTASPSPFTEQPTSLEGPPADIFSHPPDNSTVDPGQGGDSGEDRLTDMG